MDVFAGLKFQIVGYENVGKSYTEYIVVCSTRVARWEVRKRYSQFQTLNTELKSHGKVDAKLPPKQMFGKLSDAVISKRQDGLNDYLMRVHRSATLEQRHVLGAFLGVQQQSAGMHGDLQAVGYDSAGGDADADDGLGPLNAERGAMVEQVADRMIDAFQAPVPVKGRDAKARQETYRNLLRKIKWSSDGATLGEHLKACLCALPNNLGLDGAAGYGGAAEADLDRSAASKSAEERRAQLATPALSAQDDLLLTSALKQLTTATKSIQVVNKEPFVVCLGDILAASQDTI